MQMRPASIDELLLACGPTGRRLAEAARQRLIALVPGAQERLRAGWGLIGYNAPAYFAFIAPARDHVKVGFEWGVALPDPEGLLEGEGSQVRHVTVRSLDVLRSTAFAELVRAAAALRVPVRRR